MSQKCPSTDNRAAFRDFAAVPSIELNNCDRTQGKASALRKAVLYFKRDGEIWTARSSSVLRLLVEKFAEKFDDVLSGGVGRLSIIGDRDATFDTGVVETGGLACIMPAIAWLSKAW